MRKYTDVYKGEEPPKRKDVLWAHHSIKDDLTSPIVVQIFSKGKWVDAYEGGGAEVERLSEELGDITDLKTTDKDSTVDAINEVVDNVGDLSDLTTTAKADLVSAINEASTKGDPASLLYTAQSLTEAQKTQALANIGAASQQEFESLSAGEVVPVTELPNASNDTMGKIYLVGPDANDEYDRYISSYNGTNYSWVQVGTTQMDLSGYATDAEVSQLEAELNNLANTRYYGIFTSSADLPADASENGYAYVGTSTPLAIYEFDGEDWNDTGVTVNSIQGEPGVGFASVASPTPADGTVTITLSNGDTMTLDLNHNHPAYYSKVAETSNPSGGFLPDVVYSLGTLTGTVTFALAAAVTGNVNHYFWMFDTGSTAPTVTWPAGLTWAAGSAPAVAANTKYEISILGGIAYYSEM